MAIIASHHASDPWRPLLPWPSSTHVQWGGRGIVLGKPGTTAFFEAFPSDGSAGFIRGEGTTVEEAEVSAFGQWSRQHNCHVVDGGHLWTRTPSRKYVRGKPLGTYLNGGCFCLRCGAFKTAMSPVAVLGGWRTPLEAMALDGLASGFNRPRVGEEASSTRYKRKTLLKARAMGIQMPDPVPEEPGRNPFQQDDYTRACRKAVRDWLLEQASLPKESGGDGIGDFFSGMSARSLRRLVEEPSD